MKVLIIRFSSIGDVVLTSPLLRCIKEQVTNVELHYLTKAVFGELVSSNKHVDKVHLLEDDLSSVISALKLEGFDHIIDLHNNLRSKRIKSALGVKSTAVDKRNFLKWKMVNLRALARQRVPHIVERYLDAGKELGVNNDDKGMELFIPAEQTVPLSDLPESHRNGYIAFAIGAAHSTKRLTESLMIKLCEQIPKPIVLIGGPTDKERALAIQMAVGPRVHDATGEYSILRSASLLDQAEAVICHDSGAMHIACALRKRTISIWGSTVEDLGFGPYQPEVPQNSHSFQVEGLSCRPCSKIGHAQCPKGHFHCMEKQDLKRIAQLVL